MTIEDASLLRTRVKIEANGSYAVDDTGTPGNFIDLPVVSGSIAAEPLYADLPQNLSQVYLDDVAESLVGPKANTVGFTTLLVSHGQDIDGDVTPVASGSCGPIDIMETVLGGRWAPANQSAQTVVAGTPTSTVIEVTAGHGSSFTPGSTMGLTIASVYQVREVLSVSTDTVTVKEAFSAAPSVSDVVRVGITTYLTENDSTADTSLQFLIEGREAGDGYGYFGCQMTGLTWAFTIGEIITQAMQFAGAGWAQFNPTIAGADLSSVSDPIMAFPLTLHVPTVGSTTLTDMCPFSAVDITPNITWGPVKCGSATNTISSMRRMANTEGAATGSFTLPFEDQAWFDAATNRTDHAITLQCGGTVGSTVFISLPTVQILQPTFTDADGVRSTQVPFRARHDDAISSPTTDLQRSAIRVSYC